MDESSRHEAPPREAPEKVARARAFCEGLLSRLAAAAGVVGRATLTRLRKS